jgi:ferritin-like metal-binding protein YciE
VHTLQDIYYAEHTELKKSFRTHLKQTKGQIKRLDRVGQEARPQRRRQTADPEPEGREGGRLNGIAKRKINRKAAARKLPKPDRSERAENAMLVAAAGIPAI